MRWIWIYAAPKACLQLTSVISAFRALTLGLIRTQLQSWAQQSHLGQALASRALSSSGCWRCHRDVTGPHKPQAQHAVTPGTESLPCHAAVTLLVPSSPADRTGLGEITEGSCFKACPVLPTVYLECYRKHYPKAAEQQITSLTPKMPCKKAFYTNGVLLFLSSWDMLQFKPQHPFTCKLQFPRWSCPAAQLCSSSTHSFWFWFLLSCETETALHFMKEESIYKPCISFKPKSSTLTEKNMWAKLSAFLHLTLYRRLSNSSKWPVWTYPFVGSGCAKPHKPDPCHSQTHSAAVGTVFVTSPKRAH